MRGRADALVASGNPAAAVDVLRRLADEYEQGGGFRQATAVWREIDDVRRAAPVAAVVAKPAKARRSANR